MRPPILIFAIGNESRGDDALGPLLSRHLADRLQAAGLGSACEFLEEFQLQIEHALDMEGRQLVLFMDAGMDTAAPFDFYPANASTDPLLYSHALTPASLLDVYRKLHPQALPAEVFVLCIKGVSFELGEPLSEAAQIHLNRAAEFVGDWLIAASERYSIG